VATSAGLFFRKKILFLKKKKQKDFIVVATPGLRHALSPGAAARMKVLWFFLSRKNALLQ
jgi:hypothetical protein